MWGLIFHYEVKAQFTVSFTHFFLHIILTELLYLEFQRTTNHFEKKADCTLGSMSPDWVIHCTVFMPFLLSCCADVILNTIYLSAILDSWWQLRTLLPVLCPSEVLILCIVALLNLLNKVLIVTLTIIIYISDDGCFQWPSFCHWAWKQINFYAKIIGSQNSYRAQGYCVTCVEW